MQELRFPKKRAEIGELTLPITDQYKSLAEKVGVNYQTLPNIAFAFLEILHDEPEMKLLIDNIIRQITNPIPQELTQNNDN